MRLKLNKKGYVSFPYMLWSVIFVLVPLGLIFWFSLTDASGSFTLDNFKRFITDEIYISVLVRSFALSLIATAICLVIGYPTAFIISKMKEKTQSTVMLLLVLPMWMNFLLRTYAMLALLEPNGALNTFLSILHLPKIDILYTQGAIVLGMVYNYLPFMIMPIHSVMVKLDKQVLEAASDLGANPVQSFMRVIFPLTLSGVTSGITMTFLPAITTFAISKLLGGDMLQLVGDVIEQQFKTDHNWNFGSAISIIIIAVIMLFMKVLSSYEKENETGGLM